MTSFDFSLGVLQNIVASIMTAGGVFFLFQIWNKNKYREWAAQHILPLWIYYLTLENRFARIQETIMRISGNKETNAEEQSSRFEEWADKLEPIATDLSNQLALDLSKAEADSMSLLSYMSIWVRHSSSIAVPTSIAKKVWDLEEKVTEFNASLLRHTHLLQNLLQLKDRGKNGEFTYKQRNGYLKYFLGDVDRVVCSIDDARNGGNDYSKVGGCSMWTLGKRLGEMKEAIQEVNNTCGNEKATLYEGEALWRDEEDGFHHFKPMINNAV